MTSFTTLNTEIIQNICKYLSNEEILNLASLQNYNLNSKLPLDRNRCLNKYLNRLHFFFANSLPKKQRYHKINYCSYCVELTVTITNIYFAESFLKNALILFEKKSLRDYLMIFESSTTYISKMKHKKYYCTLIMKAIKSFIYCTLLEDNYVKKECIIFF